MNQVNRWETGRKHGLKVWGSDGLRGLLATNTGASLVEYALLVGVFACVALAGLQFCDDLGLPIYRRLTRSLGSTNGDEATSGALPGTTRKSARTSPDGGLERLTETAHNPLPLSSAVYYTVALVAVGLGAGAWWLRRRFRKDRAKESPQSESDRSDPLQAKRQLLWRRILEDPRLLFKNQVEVRHLMTRELSVVAPRTATEEIRRMMTEKGIHHVLVCDGDGRLFGVVSDRDLHHGQGKTAADVMTSSPITVQPGTTASSAIATLLEQQISCVPVIEDDRVCGILTRTDLIISFQCMLQWTLRFAQSLARVADCSDRIDAIQAASGRHLIDQRTRLHSLTQRLAVSGKGDEDDDLDTFAAEAQAFLDTAGELIAMQTFEGDRLAEMAGQLLLMTKSDNPAAN